MPNQYSHVILRRPNKTVRLILPCANRHVLRSAFGMYFPSRLLGKLYRAALELFLPLFVKFGWVEQAGALATWCPHLAQVIASVKGAHIAYVGALVAEPGPCSKLTLKIMNEQGDALAYARVGYSAGAIDMIRREEDVLNRLAFLPIASQVPKMLCAGKLASPSGYFLVESAGADVHAQSFLTSAHYAFLAKLSTRESRSWSDVMAQLETEVVPLLDMPVLQSAVATAMGWLRHLPSDQRVEVVIEHGDFAPWNIRVDVRGELFVLDWEHARLDGLPWMDILHFVFQQETLVEKSDIHNILSAMSALFARLQVMAGEDGETNSHQFMLLYLLRRLSRENFLGANPIQSKDVAVLALIEIVNGIDK